MQVLLDNDADYNAPESPFRKTSYVAGIIWRRNGRKWLCELDLLEPEPDLDLITFVPYCPIIISFFSLILMPFRKEIHGYHVHLY